MGDRLCTPIVLAIVYDTLNWFYHKYFEIVTILRVPTAAQKSKNTHNFE
jgi:hypothetical protein